MTDKELLELKPYLEHNLAHFIRLREREQLVEVISVEIMRGNLDKALSLVRYQKKWEDFLEANGGKD